MTPLPRSERSPYNRETSYRKTSYRRIGSGGARVLRLFPIATVMVLGGLVAGACTSDAFESQPVDQDPRTNRAETDTSIRTDTDSDADPGSELALVADSPYEEPDLDASAAEREISEAPAAEPENEPAAADPDDTSDTSQVALGEGESAVCATVQIGRDAVTDGAEDLINSQRELLVNRAELVEDDELLTLLSGIDDVTTMDSAVLDAALSRCEALGYQP